MKIKGRHDDIIKIDFILDLEIWVILQQSDQEAADQQPCERERVQHGEGKDNTKKNLQIGIYMFCVIIHQELNPNFIILFILSTWLQINQNYKSFEKYKTFKGSPT